MKCRERKVYLPGNFRNENVRKTGLLNAFLLLSSSFLLFCEWFVPVLLVFYWSSVLPPVCFYSFVICGCRSYEGTLSSLPSASTCPCLPLSFLLFVFLQYFPPFSVALLISFFFACSGSPLLSVSPVFFSLSFSLILRLFSSSCPLSPGFFFASSPSIFSSFPPFFFPAVAPVLPFFPPVIPPALSHLLWLYSQRISTIWNGFKAITTRNGSWGRRRWTASQNGAVCAMGMTIFNLVTEVWNRAIKPLCKL